MGILIDKNSCAIVQGITGTQGAYHAKVMSEYGVKVVGGVTPGKGGQSIHGIPVYDTISEVLEDSKVDVSMIMVPPAFVLGAAVEAINNNVPIIIIITEHVPVHDSMKMKALAKKKGVMLIGPNTIGVINPGVTKVGIMPTFLYGDGGNIAIASRSGTLSHETASNLSYRGLGVSTVLGIGGDPIIGTDFVDALKLFKEDSDTEAVVLIGEIGGSREEAAAEYLLNNDYGKPVFAFIAGVNSPPGKKMGHAGAIIEKGVGSADSKMSKLKEAGVTVASSLEDLLLKLEQCSKSQSNQKVPI